MGAIELVDQLFTASLSHECTQQGNQILDRNVVRLAATQVVAHIRRRHKRFSLNAIQQAMLGQPGKHNITERIGK